MNPRSSTTRAVERGSWNIPMLTQQAPGLVALSNQLSEFVEQGRPIVALTPDLSMSNGMDRFAALHPNHYLQMGVSEQNTVSVAAGLATVGFEPYVACFASFLALLCCEQIRTDLCYTKLPVRLIGHHSGISFGFYGTSHHATEDIAIMRSMANMTVVSPCDATQLRQALVAYADHPLPVYFRVGRGREPLVYSNDDARFTPGRAIIHREGSDATLVSTGSVLSSCLEAAHLLEADGLSVGVIDMHTVKPIDAVALRSAAMKSSVLISVEEHNVMGGLGSAISEILTDDGIPTPLVRHGIYDEYSLIGPPTSLYEHYGLDGDGIAVVTRDAVAKRSSR